MRICLYTFEYVYGHVYMDTQTRLTNVSLGKRLCFCSYVYVSALFAGVFVCGFLCVFVGIFVCVVQAFHLFLHCVCKLEHSYAY